MEMISRTLTKIFVSCLAVVAWLIFVFISAFYGWWMRPVAEAGNTNGFFEYATATLEENNSPGNSAILLIDAGQIVAEYYSDSAKQIDEDTVFSTASLSKWITAIGIMKLVQDGLAELDRPASSYLSRWEFPASDFDTSLVTVRHLLSHTAGLTDGLGFGDYAADEDLPSLEQALSNPRASDGNTVSLAINNKPGETWQYSGGSYLVLELIVEEVTGQSFESYIDKSLFTQIGMHRSGFAYLEDYDNNAGSYDSDGNPVPSYKYASSAATAFVTSASDLGKLVRSQIPGSGIENILSTKTLSMMLQPHGRAAGADIWGLGTMLYAPTEDGDHVYGHDGGNEPAINSTARINPATGDAIIVLVTGNPNLATRIGSQWVLWQTGYPDFLDVEAVVSSMVLPMITGSGLILIAVFYIVAIKKRKTKKMQHQHD